jgi:hypothetical protein
MTVDGTETAAQARAPYFGAIVLTVQWPHPAHMR